MIRAPICTVVGHVDHGKTTLLDAVRGTAVAAGEAGAITQAIGASIIPIEHIKSRASAMLGKKELTIPGLLFIDTPGHAAFASMRKRGGSLADIAILLVDMNEGFKPQTKEALEILRNYKTPFVIAANKVDQAPGFKHQGKSILEDLNAQTPQTTQHIETKLYELVGTLHELGVPAERFDRLESFEKQAAIVPISALHGYGIDSLLAIICGLAQRYLENNLDATLDGPAKGTILEVSEEKGIGTTLNAIIYDGCLDVGDTIVIGSIREPIVTRVRALFQPNTVGDIRDKKTRFASIKKAVAATGVKIAAPDLDGVQAGMPFTEVGPDVEATKRAIKEEIGEVEIETDEEGVIIKADNVGSLEALIMLLREKNIPIRAASIGSVTKKDIAQAQSNPREYQSILAFNVSTHTTIPDEITVIEANIIYKIIDDFERFQKDVIEKEQREELDKLPMPARIQVLPNCIFRQSNPLVCGVTVHMGTLKSGARLVKENDPHSTLGYVKEIQENKTNVKKVEQGAQVAISIPGVMGGRHVEENDVMWAAVNEDEFRELKELGKLLSPQEKDVLREFAEVMRQTKPMWGV